MSFTVPPSGFFSLDSDITHNNSLEIVYTEINTALKLIVVITSSSILSRRDHFTFYIMTFERVKYLLRAGCLSWLSFSIGSTCLCITDSRRFFCTLQTFYQTLLIEFCDKPGSHFLTFSVYIPNFSHSWRSWHIKIGNSCIKTGRRCLVPLLTSRLSEINITVKSTINYFTEWN